MLIELDRLPEAIGVLERVRVDAPRDIRVPLLLSRLYEEENPDKGVELLEDLARGLQEGGVPFASR